MKQMNDPNHEGHRVRLRRRFVDSSNPLEEHELLELILTFSIPRKDVSSVVNGLIKSFGTIDRITNAPYEELVAFPGIGESTAILLKSIGAIHMKREMTNQPPLFTNSENKLQDSKKSNRNIRVFANDEIANSLSLLPKATSFDRVEDYKNYLVNNLPYNSEKTRFRRANYIIDRFYSNNTLNTPLTFFLNQGSDEKVLKPVVFYHVLKSEPIAVKAAEELIFPALPTSRINREQLKEFTLKYFPEISDSSLKNMLRAIIYTYSLLGMGVVSGETLRFQLHQGEIESFIYVFSMEFPQPGIYSYDQLFQGPLHHWLLWDREWLRRQLYNLRDIGVISKISEIDNVKQFTVAYDQSVTLQKCFQSLKGNSMFIRESQEDSSN